MLIRVGPANALRWLGAGEGVAVVPRAQAIRQPLTPLPVGWCHVSTRDHTSLTRSARQWIADNNVRLGVDPVTVHGAPRLSPDGVIDGDGLLRYLE